MRADILTFFGGQRLTHDSCATTVQYLEHMTTISAMLLHPPNMDMGRVRIVDSTPSDLLECDTGPQRHDDVSSAPTRIQPQVRLLCQHEPAQL